MVSSTESSAGSCGCASPESQAAALCCCTVDDLVHTIGRRYAMPILNYVGRARKARFTELQEDLEVSSSTLADTLDDLVRVGLLARTVLPDTPPRTEYSLTPAGQALRGRLRPLLDHVRELE